MSVKPFTDLSRLCVHTITTKPWNIDQAARNFSKAGVKGITVWRDTLEGRNVKDTGTMISEYGLDIVSLCRGGFFPSIDKAGRQKAIDDNKRAIDDANALGAPLVVLVCGSHPEQSLEESRKQISEGIASILPHASGANVRIAIEPLHPMYADSRSAINTLAQANNMAEELNSEWLGIAVDVYHVWWDPSLKKEIERCGKNKHLFAFHICDWKVPTTDFLLDRGLMGEGCIPVREIRSWIEETGFTGYNEVEIFSNMYWNQDQTEFLNNIIQAYKAHS